VLENPDELDAYFHQFVAFLWLRTVSLNIITINLVSQVR